MRCPECAAENKPPVVEAGNDLMASPDSPRIARVFGAVNIGSFRISAMIAGLTESGEMIVLGIGHRAAQGIKRGYVTDMAAATYAVRDAIERAEKLAGTNVAERLDRLLGRRARQPHRPGRDRDRRPADRGGGHRAPARRRARRASSPTGAWCCTRSRRAISSTARKASPIRTGLHAERLGVDIHVMLADGAPMRNLTEAVQNAHLEVEAMVASPLATGYACLTAEERDLGVALVEFGAQVTNVSVYAGGMLVGLTAIPCGSADITDAIASAFGIRRFQAERLKCVHGSAIASPTDHRELIPVNGPGEERAGPIARGADDKNRIPRAELIA